MRVAQASILIVEDQVIVALELQDALEAAGYTVVGPAGRVDEALKLSRSQRIDAAVLDYDLHGQKVLPVARALKSRGVPYVLVTGYAAESLGDLSGAPHMQKPVRGEAVVRAVDALVGHP
jgi:CheY-like chemotaxis protein